MKSVNLPKSGLLHWYGVGLLALLLLSGCTVELENKQASAELAQRSQFPGTVYIGWRVFQDKCAACHGAAATGLGNAPDLLPRVRQMSSRQFVSRVLDRYDLNRPTLDLGGGNSAREAQIELIMQRTNEPLVMPAWGSEPRVSASILDLYAYLWARADGTQGPDRPAP